MEHMFEKMELTGRTYHKILRVARTIADLEEEESIRLHHLREAICYRSINEKFWGGMEQDEVSVLAFQYQGKGVWDRKC